MFIEDYVAEVEGYQSKPQVVNIQPVGRNLRQPGQNRAVIQVRIFFYDDSYLDLAETVDTSRCWPDRLSYAYQYMSAEEQIFRYDNSHEYAELNDSRDHKHVGVGDDETVISCDQPSHSQVFDEINQFLLDRSDLVDKT